MLKGSDDSWVLERQVSEVQSFVGTIRLPEAVSTTRVKGTPLRVIESVYWKEDVKWRGIDILEEGIPKDGERYMRREVGLEVLI